MANETYDNRKWKDLGVTDKTKISLSVILIVASIILGFVSFIMLLEIPTSVIWLDGLWLSTGLAVLGISSYFHNELVQFQTEVKARLRKIDNHNEE